jgi:hypothetical protein
MVVALCFESEADMSRIAIALGVGVGANGLVGSANSFTLQPVSLQGEVGLNFADTVTGLNTVTGLKLEPVMPDRHRHYRHRHRHRHS